MRVLLDTSVLVAACIERHPRHLPAFEWLKKAQAKKIEAVVSAHSLLEAFSVLTRAPFKPRITPAEARKLLDRNIHAHCRIITLTAEEYREIIKSLAEKGFRGGIVYDGLILFCARKSKAKKVATLNAVDYTRLAVGLGLDIEVAGL
ncbi:MAG: PIN domain-containing protein [Phaeodactylibacter sp.]|nr:PIN domain-containing protein [Phaeodactylibacter sp.]